MGLVIAIVLCSMTRRILSGQRTYSRVQTVQTTDVNACTGSFATAKVCLWPLRRHRFVGFEIDSVCFHEYFLGLKEIFARHIINGGAGRSR